MRIGRIEVSAGAGLAPMAGVTDACFRPLCFEQGAAFAVSEMLSAKGYLHISRNARAVDELLERSPDEGILGLQLFGHEPDVMAEAANQLQDSGFSFIDVNMGCPMHKIVSGGDGSALLRNPALCGEIVRAVVRRVSLPVTVKIRAGWDADSVNAPQVARIVEEAGAAMVAVHARTRDQFYAGHADWAVIGAVKRALAIPVLGNGDVFSGADALRLIAQTGCDAVMVGRGAQGNPWIFSEIRAALSGEPYQRPGMRERVSMALRHMDGMRQRRGERGALLEMRKHVAWYLSGARGTARLRGQINQLASLDLVRAALNEYLNECE